MGRKRTCYLGIILALLLFFPAIARAGYKTNILTATDRVKTDTIQSQTGTDTVTIVSVKSAVDLKHSAATWGTKVIDETGIDTGKIPKYTTANGGKWIMADDNTGTGGAGITGSGTPGKMMIWAGATSAGDGTDNDTSVHDAVTKAHAGSHSGTAGKIPVFTGANTLGNSTLTDTQMRERHYMWNIPDPSTLTDTTLCIDVAQGDTVTVTNIKVTCEADPAIEVVGDVKYADAFIGLGTPTLIGAFDTTNGAANNTVSVVVPAGKCVYYIFDAQPSAPIKLLTFKITYLIN